MDFYKALGADPMAKAQWSDLTPVERRDFSDWVESAEQREARRERIQEAIATLTAGKRRP
jgi:uncharacterized protein YdeI (YjbR/CyaY-like superfamily)